MAVKKAKKKEIAKDAIIKKEVTRLTKLYKNIEGNKKEVADGIIQEAAFMRATLGELKVMIDAAGPIDEMPQGEYSILREHPAVKIYNTMIQRYTSAIKQLTDLLPKEAPKVEDDGFDDFVVNRDD
jgi:hypothetical protein